MRKICRPVAIRGRLTHWGRVTHICVSKLTIIASDNGLSPGRRQAIIWTNAEILLIGTLGTNFSEILIDIVTFSFTKMRLKVSSAKWRPACLGLNELSSYWLRIIGCLSYISNVLRLYLVSKIRALNNEVRYLHCSHTHWSSISWLIMELKHLSPLLHISEIQCGGLVSNCYQEFKSVKCLIANMRNILWLLHLLSVIRSLSIDVPYCTQTNILKSCKDSSPGYDDIKVSPLCIVLEYIA